MLQQIHQIINEKVQLELAQLAKDCVQHIRQNATTLQLFYELAKVDLQNPNEEKLELELIQLLETIPEFKDNITKNLIHKALEGLSKL